MLDIYGDTEYDEYLLYVSKDVYLVKSFEKDFLNLYKKVVQIEMLEGWVLKRKKGKLERGTKQKNNMGWQIKARKENKNYSF